MSMQIQDNCGMTEIPRGQWVRRGSRWALVEHNYMLAVSPMKPLCRSYAFALNIVPNTPLHQLIYDGPSKSYVLTIRIHKRLPELDAVLVYAFEDKISVVVRPPVGPSETREYTLPDFQSE